jgi:hypothetical protein
MWLPVSDPSHAEGREFGEGGPLSDRFKHVLQEIASRPFACKVYGHFSLARFIIGTAPSYATRHNPGHRNILCIDDTGSQFRIGYEKTSAGKWANWRDCPDSEVAPFVEKTVTEDLEAHREKDQ